MLMKSSITKSWDKEKTLKENVVGATHCRDKLKDERFSSFKNKEEVFALRAYLMLFFLKSYCEGMRILRDSSKGHT